MTNIKKSTKLIQLIKIMDYFTECEHTISQALAPQGSDSRGNGNVIACKAFHVRGKIAILLYITAIYWKSMLPSWVIL